MPKEYKIKWRKNDIEKARRTIKNYNARIDYQIKKNPQNAEFYPEKIKLKEVKELVMTRKEFNKKLKSLESFTAESAAIITNPQGEKATIYQINETRKNVRAVNAKRAEELKRLQETAVYVKGKELTNVQKMIDMQGKKPVTYDFNKAQKGEFKRFAERFEAESFLSDEIRKAQLHFDNMIESCYSIFGKDDGETLEEMLKNAGVAVVDNLYKRGHDEFDLDWWYSDPVDDKIKFDRIVELLKPYQPKEEKPETKKGRKKKK